MNLTNIIVRLGICLGCLMSASIVTENFETLVLAQNTITLDNYLPHLSEAEKASLNQGKVILRGEKGNYLGRVLAQGNLDTAWEVLTDYDNFEKFLPNITSSQVINEEGNRLIFEQVNVVDLWLFQQEFKVQIEATKTKPKKIDFKILDGDLKKLIGRWEITEISSGEVLISHGVEVEPGSNTEKPFFYGVYESTLEETLQAIAVEISQRSLAQ